MTDADIVFVCNKRPPLGDCPDAGIWIVPFAYRDGTIDDQAFDGPMLAYEWFAARVLDGAVVVDEVRLEELSAAIKAAIATMRHDFESVLGILRESAKTAEPGK